jgi:hypothetical protein
LYEEVKIAKALRDKKSKNHRKGQIEFDENE